MSPSGQSGPGEHRREVPRAVVDVERQHIRARLRRLVVDTRALNAAVEDEFGPEFDRERWAGLFNSDAPRDVNKVSAVISAYERIVNGLVEAARSGLVASGVGQPVGTPESVRRDLERVRDDGGLSDLFRKYNDIRAAPGGPWPRPRSLVWQSHTTLAASLPGIRR